MSTGVVHIVVFSYLPHIQGAERSDIAARFLGLLGTCLLDGKPYIVSVKGGRNHSVEDGDKALQHAYIVDFRTQAELDYYISEDPVHQAFKAFLAGKVATKVVCDFVPGLF